MLKQFRQEGFDLTSFECWTFDAAMAELGEGHKYNKEPADVRGGACRITVFEPRRCKPVFPCYFDRLRCPVLNGSNRQPKAEKV